MFFLRRGVSHCRRSLERAAIRSGAPRNLKFIPNVESAKYSTNAKAELSLTDDAKKRFIEFVKEELAKGPSGASDFISPRGYEEISRLLRNRNTVEESIRSLEDLGEQDAEMKKMGEDEYSGYLEELDRLDDELLDCILCHVARDSCSDVILEITMGVGGQEAMLFARDLLEMYLGHLEYLGYRYEIIHHDSTSGAGGIRHASITASGKQALEMLRHEAGVHRVQRIPATEKSGRVHTSTVSVAVLPQPSEVQVVIKDKDLKIETKNASGAGGQHVNTTDSAVRITHLPTGISVECQTDRSQIRNRRIAMLRLRTIIYEKELNAQRETSGDMRKKQIGLGMRNEKIRTYNYNQDRITDHRIADGTTHNLKGFLQGGQVLRDLQLRLQRDMKMKMLLEIVRRSAKQ